MSPNSGRDCCTSETKALVFNAYNISFFLIGVIDLCTFFYVLERASHYFNLFNSSMSFWILCVLAAASGLILFSSILGLIATKTSKLCILYCYIILLIAIMLLELLVAASSYFMSTNLDLILPEDLNITFYDYYKYDQRYVSINYIHRKEKCCGIHSYEDWLLDGRNFEMEVPDSCCRSYVADCGKRLHPSNIYFTGCINSIKKRDEYFFDILSLTTIIIFFIPTIGISLALQLYFDFQNKLYELEKEEKERLRKNDDELYM